MLSRGFPMFLSRLLSFGGLLSALLLVVSLALVGPAEARMGGSFGSRGMRTFSSPSITSLAPNSVSPIQRSMTPNSGGFANPGYGGYGNSGFGFGRGGFWPGFAAAPRRRMPVGSFPPVSAIGRRRSCFSPSRWDPTEPSTGKTRRT